MSLDHIKPESPSNLSLIHMGDLSFKIIKNIYFYVQWFVQVRMRGPQNYNDWNTIEIITSLMWLNFIEISNSTKII